MWIQCGLHVFGRVSPPPNPHSGWVTYKLIIASPRLAIRVQRFTFQVLSRRKPDGKLHAQTFVIHLDDPPGYRGHELVMTSQARDIFNTWKLKAVLMFSFKPIVHNSLRKPIFKVWQNFLSILGVLKTTRGTIKTDSGLSIFCTK